VHPSSARSGYIELPYTLPQDSTLFLLFRERTNAIWQSKLDWIAKYGGLIFLDTHPDYMSMDGAENSPREYRLDFYASFLSFIRSKYKGAYWHALPHQVARMAQDVLPVPAGAEFQTAASAVVRTPPAETSSGWRDARPTLRVPPKVWIDLDNTPHVPFFTPIIQELERRGYDVSLTARDAFQVRELAVNHGLNVKILGRHYGKNKLLKLLGLACRTLQLMPRVLANRPHLALSHGARSQMLLSNLLRIPTVLIDDYEYSVYPPLVVPQWMIIPEASAIEIWRDENRVAMYDA